MAWSETMRPVTHGTKRGPLTLRGATLEDVQTLIELNKTCFPLMAEENVVWNKGQLASHLNVFPDGQIVAELDGKIVGAVASLIVRFGVDAHRPHTYAGITDGGYFYNHDPQGDTLYGADVYVHPDSRGLGVGHYLYEARRDLCKRLNLRRILAGGRIHGYADHSDHMSPEQYVRAVELGTLQDLVLSFQLREGFVARKVLRNYIRDPRSKNCATLIEWLNTDYRPAEGDGGERKVRVACVQYQMRRVQSFKEFGEQVEYFVEAAARYRADFVLFPELFAVQLLSQSALQRLPSLDAIQRLAAMEHEYFELLAGLARDYGLAVVAGSYPLAREGRIYNTAPLFFPDGHFELQPKLHITPAEREDWGITGGDALRVFATHQAKVGILVCYDAEFPEAARYLADQGAEIIFVPYCTDSRAAHLRVRLCCQARAIENQLYVVTAGVIGNLPSVQAIDVNYGRAAVFTPSDFEFARDGVQAQADSNVEMLLVSDLDINDLYRSRAAGSITPRFDRRTDLFEFVARLSNEPVGLALDDAPPLDPSGPPEAE